MKVLHISAAKSWRGGEQQIAYLLEELRASGIEQSVFCVAGAPLATFCAQEKIPFDTYKKRASVDPVPAFKLRQLMQQKAIDLVHIHDAHAHTLACISASFFGVRQAFILSRRVDFPIKNNSLSYWKYNHKNIKAILCVSHFIQEVIKPDIRESSKIQVVHSGIDLDRFHHKKQSILRDTFQIPATSPLLANVAAIAPHKDYFTFVDTAAIILAKRPEVRFLIIGGDGGEEQLIRDYIRKKKLEAQIRLTGFRKDIPAILPELDLFLFTSKEEGLGTSLLDALASRVPVVATRAGGAVEIIEHERTGLLAEVKDADRLATEALRLLDDPGLQKKLIENGLKKAASFTKQETARKTLQVYQSLYYQKD